MGCLKERKIFKPGHRWASGIRMYCMWHFRVVPIPEVMLFTRKKASLLKQTDLGVMFKKASEYVCTSIIVLSPDPSSPIPSVTSAMNIIESTE